MWRSSFLARVLIWFVALAGLGLYALAQGNTGNVYGNVVDEQGTVIPGGSAMLTGPAAPRTTGVDSSGVFRFLKVPPGKYSVIVTMPGFTTVTRDNVLVSVGHNTQVDVQLKLSNVQEAVTVSAATPLLDTRKVETGQNFSSEELTQIPTARDVWSLIAQVPGVQIDTVNVAGNSSAVAGGPDFITKGSGNVVYQVDGATITDNTYGNPLGRQNGGTNTFFDFSTFEDVEVATGGSVVEQQNSGVTINVVTKRGTNQLKGSARFLYASANWQSDNTSQEAIDQGWEYNDTRFIREYGLELGGPILKDKLWIWGAGSRQDISLASFNYDATETPVPQTTTLEPWSAKLNAQISNANAAALYFSRSNRIENGRCSGAPCTAARPPDTRTELLIPTNFYKVEDSNVFSADLFASIFANYQDVDYTSNPSGGLAPQCAPPFDVPPAGCAQIDFYGNDDGSDGSWHNTWNYFYAKDPQKQANLSVSKFFNTGSINHELKASFNYRTQTADSASGIPGDQLQGYEYSYSSATALISRGVRTIYKTQYLSGTLGDTLTAGNLTVNAGVRYDLQQGKNLPSRSFGNQIFPELLPTVEFHGTEDWQFEYTNWQPRLSATYALGEKKNTLLRGSYAQFADQLGYIVYYGNGTPIANGSYYYWTDTNRDHTVQRDEIDLENGFYGFYNGIDPNYLPNIPNQLQPGFKTPLTNEFTFGVDQQITDNFALSATFSYRTTKNLQEAVPTGSSLSTYDLAGIATGSADAYNGFTIDFAEPFYGLTLDEAPVGSEFRNRPGATQRYYGVDFSVVKRLSDCWMLRGNFGWNNFRQYLTPESIQDPNNLWALGGQNDDGALAVGYSSKSSVFLNGSWQFNVNALYMAPWGIGIGANFFGRQGYPNPYYVRAYTEDVALNRVNILIGEVDTYRYDNVYQLDLRLEKSFQIGPVTVIPAAEVFNVANSGTVLERYQRTGIYRDGEFDQDANFNDILDAQSARILRLGIRVNF